MDSDDGEDYGKAAKQFECAVAARPNFAVANAFVSNAKYFEGSSQSSEDFPSLSNAPLFTVADREGRAVSGLQREGLRPSPELLVSYGWDLIEIGLLKRDRKSIARGVQLNR